MADDLSGLTPSALINAAMTSGQERRAALAEILRRLQVLEQLQRELNARGGF